MLEEAHTVSVVSVQGALVREKFSLLSRAASVWAWELGIAVWGTLHGGFGRQG